MKLMRVSKVIEIYPVAQDAVNDFPRAQYHAARFALNS